MKYRSEIDGLRALAVLPVILFHAGFPIFSGGFVGVDIFFVISGYLITGIIAAEMAEDRFSFQRFYARRARRILPAQYALLLVTMPIAWLVLWPMDLVEFAKALIYLALFGANLLYYKSSGYFDTSAELKPLLHTWSLSVEEQFYFIFPAILLLVWRWKKQASLTIVASLTLLSLAYAQWQVHRYPAAAFYLLPARFWEIGLGAVISLSDPYRFTIEKRLGGVAGVSGLLLIVVAIFAFDPHTPNPSLYTLLPTLGAALILRYAKSGTWAAKVLTLRLLVGIGLISYSAYLWHQPVLAFARHITPNGLSDLLKVTLILMTFLAAWLSWRFVELPFRRQSQASNGRIATLALLSGLVLLAMGQTIRHYQGFETFFFAHRLTPDEQRIYTLIREQTRENPIKALLDNGECRFRSEKLDAKVEQRFLQCSQKFGKATLIIGDSHAINIFNALYKEGDDNFLVGIARVGCRPYEAEPECPYPALESFVATHADQIRYVLFHQSGSHLMKDLWGRKDHDELFSRPNNFTIQTEDIDRISQYLDRLGKHAKVFWLGPFTEARVNFADFRQFIDGFHLNPYSIAAFERLDHFLENVASSQQATWQYVSANQALALSANYLLTDHCLTFRDKDHFSACGEQIAGKRLREALKHPPISAAGA